MIHRRAFLLGMTGVAASVLAAGIVTVKPLRMLFCTTPEDFFSRFKTRHLSASVGGIFLKSHSVSETKTKSLILNNIETKGCDALAARIQRQVIADYAARDFIAIDGWLLPRTSVELSAMMGGA